MATLERGEKLVALHAAHRAGPEPEAQGTLISAPTRELSRAFRTLAQLC